MTDTEVKSVSVSAPAETVTPQEPANPAPEFVDPTADPAPEAETSEDAATPELNEPGDDAADGGKPKKKGGFQKRIEELTTEKYKERMLREAAERRAQQLEEQLKPKDAAVPADEPKLEQFPTLEEYTKARDRWVESNALKRAQADAATQADAAKVMETKARLAAKEDEARRKYADFDQAVMPAAPIIMGNPVLQGYVAESDMGTDVAYHLAKNPVKLAEVLEMSPLAAVKELIKIEERIKNPPPKPVTKAPDPIKPVGSSEKAAFSYETASMDEYAKRRREERRKAKG